MLLIGILAGLAAGRPILAEERVVATTPFDMFAKTDGAAFLVGEGCLADRAVVF